MTSLLKHLRMLSVLMLRKGRHKCFTGAPLGCFTSQGGDTGMMPSSQTITEVKAEEAAPAPFMTTDTSYLHRNTGGDR